jgi:hypothetical protein
MHYQLSTYFANPDWIVVEKNRFMNVPSLQPDFYLRRCVESTEYKILRRRGLVATEKLISDQTLGFWTSLFEAHHYGLIGGCVIHCFLNRPSTINRSSISTKLSRIRDFRNRVYHNEPICFSGSAVNLSGAIQVKADIYDLVGWIDPTLTLYFTTFDEIEKRLDAIRAV